MGTFSRLRYVIAANVNALLEKTEDPEKLLRALIREMEDASEEARRAGAELLAGQLHLQRRQRELETEAGEWQRRAERAVVEQRDDLAREALKARVVAESDAEATGRELRLLEERSAGLEADMATLQEKLLEARSRLRGLFERTPGQTAPSARPSHAERRLRRALDRFDRLQSKVERLEAEVESYETGARAVDIPADPAVEAELGHLKHRLRDARGDESGPLNTLPGRGHRSDASSATESGSTAGLLRA